jgi:streptogramin lyase
MLIRRSLLALALLAAAVLALAPTASAEAPGEVVTFKFPGCLVGDGAHLAAAPGEGVLARACKASGDRLGSSLSTVSPGGEIVPRAIPKSPTGPIAAGPAGEVWLAENPEAGAFLELPSGATAIDRIAPDGTVERFPLGSGRNNAEIKVYGLVVGGDGTAWAATGEPMVSPGGLNASVGGELIRIGTDGAVSRFRVPGKLEPQGLALGPEGNLWFTGVELSYQSEHTWSPGTGRIGEMTPTGEFSMSGGTLGTPGDIALAPDGLLWFTETGTLVNQIGSVAPGTGLGSIYEVHRRLLGGLTFGPEGAAWMATEFGLVRVTADGQETDYPGQAYAVATGREGDIWALGRRKVTRVTPDGPGIDVAQVRVHPGSGTVSAVLGCGGSRRACRGVVELMVPGRKAKEPPLRLARSRYSVPAESRRGRTFTASAEAIALARRYPHVVPMVVHATVAGGPTLERRVRVHSLVTK